MHFPPPAVPSFPPFLPAATGHTLKFESLLIGWPCQEPVGLRPSPMQATQTVQIAQPFASTIGRITLGRREASE
jgi:hypothetical protein